MAGKFKDTWLIWVLFIVAAVVAVLAFSKEKPKDQAPAASAVAQPAAVPQQEQAPAGAIKPSHTTQDMNAIAAHKASSAIVMPPQNVPAHDVFAVQVYSFKEKTRAEAALKAIKDKGYPCYIMVSDLGPRGIWYRVRVGTFSAEADALKTLESITKDFKSGIIVTE